MKRLAIIAALLAMAAPSFAQDGATPVQEAAETVTVSSIRDPALQPYRRMLRGLDAYEEKRALAPDASLRFELLTLEGKPAAPEGLQLRLAGNRVDIPLPVDADATFVLSRNQDAYDDEADLVSNRKKDQLRWRPRVRTPGVPDNARRLGDLRLECEIQQAVRKEEIPLMYRVGAVAAGGICNLPMVGYVFRSPRRLASATVVSGERKAGLPLHANGEGFHVPMRDKRWDNEALVVFEFAEVQAQPAP